MFDPDKITKQIMGEMRTKAQRQLPSITCPEHGKTFSVSWVLRGKDVVGEVDDPCCETLEQELQRQFAQLRLT